MSWPTSRFIALGSIAFVGLVSLVTFQATSRAEARRVSPLFAAEAQAVTPRGPVWVPEVVTAPGQPVQCGDGTWTRSMVRGGCARHGGVAY
jgi:hypothetical protein